MSDLRQPGINIPKPSMKAKGQIHPKLHKGVGKTARSSRPRSSTPATGKMKTY